MNVSCAERTWFSVTRGLTILFLTETWKKVSFCGVQVLLLSDLVEGMSHLPANASVLRGLRPHFVYLAPIVLVPIASGYIADSRFGRRQ